MIPKILISPSLETRVGEIEKILSSFGLKNPHPDVLYFEADSKLGVAEAKKIRGFLSFKPYQAKGRGVVLEDASSLTMEAQNGLLKTLEEPPESAVIILGARSDANFLPTILSRCQVVRLQATGNSEQEKDYSQDIQRLISSDISARFEYIEKLKGREEFLHSLVSFFRQQLPSHADFLKELLEAEKWAAQNVNIRGILEYLMLVMPATK